MADKHETTKISLVLNSDDTQLLRAVQAYLVADRGGPVTLSETVRHAVRFSGMLCRTEKGKRS